MSFDLATAKPGAFDLSTAKPVMGPKDVPDSPPVQGNFGQPDTDLSAKVEGGLEAGASILSSATTGMLGRAGGFLGGMAGNIASGKYGTPEGAAEVARSAEEWGQKLTYTPLGAEGREYLENVGRAVDATKIAGLGPSEAVALSGAPVKQSASAARQAVGPEVDALKKIPGKVADIVTPKPSPEIAALAKKAEDMGIQLRPDMLADNRIAKFIGEALEQVPLSGSKAEQRQIAFNGALSKIIGAEGKEKRLTPLVFDKAMTASGEKIGRISKETPIRVDADMRRVLDERIAQVGKFETADVAKIVTNYVTELGEAANKNGGVIPGETFRKINSQIGRQVRSTSNGDLKNALYELQEDMHDALEKNIAGSARLAELKEARYQYAMGKIIEPLVATAKGGDISPSALMGAVTSDKAKKSMMARGRGGEIGDLARIGQAFLKEPPSSGSGERLGAYGLLTGGAVAEPHTAAGIVAAANLYNRLGPSLTKRAINRRAADPVENAPWNAGGDVNDIVRRLSQ